MNDIADITREISNRDNFLLISHAIPDGDSIGSLLGMHRVLKNLGKKSRMLLQDPVPRIYQYLPESSEVMSPAQFDGIVENVIFLDCADEERAGEELLPLLSSRSFTINIDHHQSNTMFGDLNYVQPDMAATAEIVYYLAKALPVEIDPLMANALYAGIVQDTGSFHHNNTRAETFRIAADLLECGVDLAETSINLFESKSRAEMRLLICALNSMQFSTDGQMAWMTVTYKEAESLGVLDLHPEGIINHTLMVEGVEVGILFRETKPGTIKVGYRSKGKVDVARLASAFGGGGHRQAAGVTMEGSLEQIKDQVINAVREVTG
jgi:phosphoesterase RecJ-like protein